MVSEISLHKLKKMLLMKESVFKKNITALAFLLSNF